ncbi:hypothetical protein BpHYR1_047092 [Brachionus plicatilis]|uniref:Uncharacterized protein n=1 Tax=Brachionus plicatilis TaxID=10195 RepID=A0A3M7PSB2_BRAPC|nr:hypothetical protein BpHYR1_047092 [Brachionus plicatilis]
MSLKFYLHQFIKIILIKLRRIILSKNKT